MAASCGNFVRDHLLLGGQNIIMISHVGIPNKKTLLLASCMDDLCNACDLELCW